MNKLFKIQFLLCILYLGSVHCRTLWSLDSWVFHKSNTEPNDVICNGTYCDEVDIQVVVCKGVYLDIEYTCNTPDLRDDDELDANYTIICKDNVFKNENCDVYVELFKKSIDNYYLEKIENVQIQSLSIVTLTIYMILGQILIAIIFIPISYCLSKMLIKPK